MMINAQLARQEAERIGEAWIARPGIPAGGRPPQIGDIIRESDALSCSLRVTMVREIDGLLYIEFIPLPPCPQDKSHTGFLNQYVVDGDRIRSQHPCRPGGWGYSSNGGGRDGDGYDEIIIIERARQASLF
jgi:hypothetical protein